MQPFPRWQAAAHLHRFAHRFALSVALALGVSLAGCAAFNPSDHAAPSAQAIEAAQQTSFETLDFDWVDETRQRALPVRLYWPSRAAMGPVPLIVFSHGIGGSRAGYSYLGQYWASRGYASMHVQHVGSDRGLWCCNPFTLVSRLQAAASEKEAVARALDVRHALDKLLASERGAHIDRRHMVVAGHSYGANTAMLVAGARVVSSDQSCNWCDPRFSAALLISAPPFYGRQDMASILAGVVIPTLHITASNDVIRIPGFDSPLADRVRVFEATGSPSKILAVFEGGSHSVFTDRALTGGLMLNPKIKEATRSLSLAFFQRTFAGDEPGLLTWHSEHAAMIATYRVQ